MKTCCGTDVPHYVALQVRKNVLFHFLFERQFHQCQCWVGSLGVSFNMFKMLLFHPLICMGFSGCSSISSPFPLSACEVLCLEVTEQFHLVHLGVVFFIVLMLLVL
jgi:hypothetical protein